MAAGHEAACLFVVLRPDAARFAPCFDKDPRYAQLVADAAAAGAPMMAEARGVGLKAWG